MKNKFKTSAMFSAACLCIASLPAQAQNAEPGTGLQFRVGAGLAHDSNVLRAPGGSSSSVANALAGVSYDKQYSLQRIVLDAEFNTYRFNDFSSLNYHTLDYLGAWHYAFTPRFTGVASVRQREYRDTSVSSTGVNVANVRTERTQLVEGTYSPGGGWLARGGVSHTSSHTELDRASDSSPRITSVRVGSGYQFRSGSSAIGELRYGNGSYGNLNIDFKEQELAGIVHWATTAKTTVDGRLGWLKRTHDNNPAFDFSGWVGNARANWDITGKTSLAGGFDRELGSYEFGAGGHVRTWRAYVEPIWRATAKTSLRLRYAHEREEWETASTGAPDFGRADSVNALSLVVNWEPIRRVVVTGTLRHEKRDSNIGAFGYSDNIVGVAARYVF